MGEHETPTRDQIEAACEALVARDGAFAVHDAVGRALVASGWDPAGDGAPSEHDLGIAWILEANVDPEADLARYLQAVEGQLRGRQAPSFESFRPLARRILQRIIEDGAPAV